MRMTLERAIGTLPERYQKVVFLYYTNELTMKEIGDVLGVNESRVSQIHKTALKRMAVALQSRDSLRQRAVIPDAIPARKAAKRAFCRFASAKSMKQQKLKTPNGQNARLGLRGSVGRTSGLP